MAGRPRKFTNKYYTTVEAQSAQRVSVGIVGKGRPSRDKVIALLSLRKVAFSADASTDRLTFELDKSVTAELAANTELAAPTAKATKVRTGPMTEKGHKIAAGRKRNAIAKLQTERAEKAGLVMLPGVKVNSTPAKSRKVKA